MRAAGTTTAATTGRHKLFATWKKQVSLAQSLTLAAAAVEAAVRTEGLFELSVCPSMTALASVARVCAGRAAVTAQNMGWDDSRSLTGETSATDLADLGCRYVILGHSERRRYLGETNDMLARKLQTAFAHRLTPIRCIGDTLEEHRAGRSEAAVRSQLEVLLGVYRLTGVPFLIAYEPAWAISTSEHAQECTPAEAAGRHGFIRSVIADELGAQLAADTTLLYGGSVTAGNADTYFTQPDIDGGLVGGASQDPASFHALINATRVVAGNPTDPPIAAELADPGPVGLITILGQAGLPSRRRSPALGRAWRMWSRRPLPATRRAGAPLELRGQNHHAVRPAPRSPRRRQRFTHSRSPGRRHRQRPRLHHPRLWWSAERPSDWAADGAASKCASRSSVFHNFCP